MFLLFMSIWAVAIGCLIVFAIFRSKARVKAKAKAETQASSVVNDEAVDVSAADDKYKRAIEKLLARGLIDRELVLRPANQDSQAAQANIAEYLKILKDSGSDVFVKSEHHSGRIPKAYAVDLSRSKDSSGRDNTPTFKVLR